MKFRSLALLMLAEVAAMSLWFIAAAVMPDMLRDVSLSPLRQAAMTSGVQAGFVLGALASAGLGLADRFDPRRIFAVSAVAAGLINALLLVVTPGSLTAIGLRVLTGALVAGVYPIGMKIAVGWGLKDRGFLVGALVGAVILGSASPHAIALAGGADWHLSLALASLAAVAGGLLALTVRLGPYHGLAAQFDVRAIAVAWTNRRVRLAYAGYLGHMFELYVMWVWIAAASALSYAHALSPPAAENLSKLTGFLAIGIGGVTSAIAGRFADRIGKAEIAIVAMAMSGCCALAAGATFGGPVWLTFAIVILWGAAISPDSAQFSALVADHAPQELAGSLLTLQTALGFALTIATVQLTPLAVAAIGWPAVLASLALGPAFGIAAMLRLRSMG
jgi:MFS family permease